ncbi:protein of unknown function [Draconibacterium orientale]|uniref:Uncharacterized protein n=1 Tax=Draconibacterium orientale TaxID=1168034 RepID=X5DEZ6_9BACT|nr:DUF4133 domain-containing protein [Draconibacterium orientale]AHW61478.1 hypothetical protein FH5T_01940 [Draconibacterium orientale]SEU10787.1 protein of unknown function [Draconibacterium orientale]
MKKYTIQKIDTNLYIKGFSGQLVYLALYGILLTLIVFVVLYMETPVKLTTQGQFKLTIDAGVN